MLDASKNINNANYADQIQASQANDTKVQDDALLLADIMDKGTVHIGDAPAEEVADDAVVTDDQIPPKDFSKQLNIKAAETAAAEA